MEPYRLLAAMLLCVLPTSIWAGEEELTEMIEEVGEPSLVDEEALDAETARLRYSRDISEAKRLYNRGLLLTVGGLLLTPITGGLGGIAYIAGEPMMGIGAGRLNRIATASPRHIDPGSGWGYYGAGWGLKLAGGFWAMSILFGNIGVAGTSPVFLPYSGATWDEMAPALLTLAAGLVCESVALYKFHSRKKAALASLAPGLTWNPTLERGSAGEIRPGMTASLALH